MKVCSDDKQWRSVNLRTGKDPRHIDAEETRSGAKLKQTQAFVAYINFQVEIDWVDIYTLCEKDRARPTLQTDRGMIVVEGRSIVQFDLHRQTIGERKGKAASDCLLRLRFREDASITREHAPVSNSGKEEIHILHRAVKPINHLMVKARSNLSARISCDAWTSSSRWDKVPSSPPQQRHSRSREQSCHEEDVSMNRVFFKRQFLHELRREVEDTEVVQSIDDSNKKGG
ncbi:hypothetical protein B0F90DRAFT_96425 [Multifurca ochricompacta]|uniref:Uncharacterized protein n=1 Tax=Multifurca ochricompacta TaxID=376703 RepID=A0AAD4MCQ7_9AGAM|nr:hypothetical protein B0F90DRAFT_96425 [Multifurca ochricompacta]